MKKAIRKARGGKRPGSGRKPTGVDPARTIRLSDEFIATVDAWAGRQDDTPSRSEAVRRLVEIGLAVKTKMKPTGRLRAALVADLAAEAIDSLGPKFKTPARTAGKPGRRLRAQELATKAIDKMIDPSAPPEERAQRRRRLTKGPLEFREARIDQPKAKK
jgi:hypothetical protein